MSFLTFDSPHLDPHYLMVFQLSCQIRNVSLAPLTLLDVLMTTSFSLPSILPSILAGTYYWSRALSPTCHVYSFTSIPTRFQKLFLHNYLNHRIQNCGRLTQEIQLYQNMSLQSISLFRWNNNLRNITYRSIPVRIFSGWNCHGGRG